MTKGRRTQDFLEGFRSCLFDHQLPYSDDLVYYDLNDSLPGKIGKPGHHRICLLALPAST